MHGKDRTPVVREAKIIGFKAFAYAYMVVRDLARTNYNL